MNTSTEKYNKKAYTKYTFRAHKGSALEDKIQAMIADGHSLNWLITELLCNHFNVPIPHKYRFIVTKEPLVPGWRPKKE